jgi:hypothetical protein
LNRETRERMERRILSEYERVRAETLPARVEEAPVEVPMEETEAREVAG